MKALDAAGEGFDINLKGSIIIIIIIIILQKEETKKKKKERLCK